MTLRLYCWQAALAFAFAVLAGGPLAHAGRARGRDARPARRLPVALYRALRHFENVRDLAERKTAEEFQIDAFGEPLLCDRGGEVAELRGEVLVNEDDVHWLWQAGHAGLQAAVLI